jgi:2-polyprenyl-3-methyl-5-hydroxy-6-metoxy-1,4-benzoquinol methylase
VAEKISFIDSNQWRSIDNTNNPDAFVAFLDEVTVPKWDVLPEAVRLLEVSPGCSVLDVGSGAGRLLIELASRVDGVRAVGIDASQKMVTTATSRAQSAGVAVQFELGDAQRLNFPDESFDRVNCSLVLVHVEDPGAVVAEIARVLAPGGRVAFSEPDAGALMVDSVDVATAMLRQFFAGLRNPDVSRQLRRLVLDSGLDLLEASRVTLGEFDLLDYLDYVAKAGNVAAEVADQWRIEIEAADPSSQTSVPAVAFRALATKNPR